MPLLVPGHLADGHSKWYAHGYTFEDTNHSCLALMEKRVIPLDKSFISNEISVGEVRLCLHFDVYPEVFDFSLNRLSTEAPMLFSDGFMGRIQGDVAGDFYSLKKLGCQIIKRYYHLFT